MARDCRQGIPTIEIPKKEQTAPWSPGGGGHGIRGARGRRDGDREPGGVINTAAGDTKEEETGAAGGEILQYNGQQPTRGEEKKGSMGHQVWSKPLGGEGEGGAGGKRVAPLREAGHWQGLTRTEGDSGQCGMDLSLNVGYSLRYPYRGGSHPCGRAIAITALGFQRQCGGVHAASDRPTLAWHLARSTGTDSHVKPKWCRSYLTICAQRIRATCRIMCASGTTSAPI